MSTVALVDNFRRNIKDACNQRGITQAKLARDTGIHFVTISRILSGKITPTLDTCERIAEAAGVRPDTVFLEPVKNSA